jgi:salicylate hydroxylase
VADKLVINFTDGTSAAADVLLGSDGIHSAVRNYFVPTAKARWTGWVAFRSVFPRSCLDHIPNLPDEAVHIWGPDRMLFMSPLAQDLFTIVGSYQSNPNAPDAPYKDSIWNSEGDVNELREYYKNWSPMVRSVIDSTPYIRIYPNAAANGLETWILGDSRVTLAGDAAHAHGGAFAAGGSLAIDDAWAFSESILHTFSNAEYDHVSKRDKISAALRIYEAVRKAHTDKVQNIVQVRNKKLLDRLGTIETDESLRKRMANREDLSWIHEHDVEQVFRQVLADEESTTHTAHL